MGSSGPRRARSRGSPSRLTVAPSWPERCRPPSWPHRPAPRLLLRPRPRSSRRLSRRRLPGRPSFREPAAGADATASLGRRRGSPGALGKVVAGRQWNDVGKAGVQPRLSFEGNILEKAGCRSSFSSNARSAMCCFARFDADDDPFGGDVRGSPPSPRRARHDRLQRVEQERPEKALCRISSFSPACRASKARREVSGPDLGRETLLLRPRAAASQAPGPAPGRSLQLGVALGRSSGRR